MNLTTAFRFIFARPLAATGSFALTALLALQTHAANLETLYINTDLLSTAEVSALEQQVQHHQLHETTGSYAIIFPDSRLPLSGAAADALFKTGQVRIVSFSAIENTFMGSMNLGKRIAEVNNAPVLAVHSGYGNDGPYTQGPAAFYMERLANLQQTITSIGEEAIDPVLTLLAATPAANFQQLSFVGYSLGCYKAAQVGWHLETTNPKLLAKTDLLGLAIGFETSTHFHSVLQIAGNRDQFGRINSTNLLTPEIVLGRDHLIRTDSPKGLPVPAMSDIPELLHLRSLRADNLKIAALSADDRLEAMADLQAQMSNFDSMVGEVLTLGGTGLTDTLHLQHLNIELNRATRNYNLVAAADAQANNNLDQIDGFKKAAAAAQTKLDEAKALFNSTNLMRTGITDTEESAVWAEKTSNGTKLL